MTPSPPPDLLISGRVAGFLNGFPITGDDTAWTAAMQRGLIELFGDIDRVSVNLNLFCDPHHPEIYTEHTMDTSMHSDGPGVAHGSNVTVTQIKGEKISDLFVREAIAYMADRPFHPPSSFHYYLTEWAYLGSLIFWRDSSKPPISQRTLMTMETVHPFITYLFSAALAFRQSDRPFDNAFRDGLMYLEADGNLTTQEQRVVTLKLFGHSYKQIAAKLDLSIDTVRSHVKSIHRKTKTRSHTELFAKYFTPRGNLTDGEVDNYL